MLLCPDCQAALPGGPADCRACGWECRFEEQIPLLLSSADRESASFASYMRNYDQIAEDDLVTSMQPQQYLRVACETLHSYLPPVRGRHVCELGVGQGMLFSRLLEDEPESLTGLDISLAYLRRFAPTAQQLSGRVRLAVANAENIPYESEFDLVVASEILEHVLNVGDLLVSLNRCLVPGGHVAVRVPFAEDLRQYARQNGCQYEFVHLRTFTRDSLVSMMRLAGFRRRSLYYDGYASGRRRRLFDLLFPALRPYFDRAFVKRSPRSPPNRLRAFMQPVTLTGVFQKT